MSGTAPDERARSETYRETVARLAAAQKSGRGAPAYSRFVNRRLGRLLAAAAFHVGLTPNVVTAISGVFSFAAIAAVALVAPSWSNGLLIAALLVLGYALDAADGQLARLRGGGSVSGEWLDHMVDCAKISSLHLAVAITFFRFSDLADAWLLVPLGYTVVAATSFFAQILNEQLLRAHRTSAGPADAGRPSVTVSLLKVPTDYGLLCLIFLLFGWQSGFLALYTLMFAVSATYLLLASVKWYGQMVAADRGAL